MTHCSSRNKSCVLGSLLCSCSLWALPGEAAGCPHPGAQAPPSPLPLTTTKPPHWAPSAPAVLCFALTRSLLLTALVTAALLGLRYYYSRKVVLAYLDCALHTDMADIEQYYMKPPGESLKAPAAASSSLCPPCLRPPPRQWSQARPQPSGLLPGWGGRARQGWARRLDFWPRVGGAVGWQRLGGRTTRPRVLNEAPVHMGAPGPLVCPPPRRGAPACPLLALAEGGPSSRLVGPIWSTLLLGALLAAGLAW